jgi:hypothetical protein
MTPVKENTYEEQTFALRIPLELGDDDLVHFKMTRFSRLCLLGKVLWIPPTPLWERFFFWQIFRCP